MLVLTRSQTSMSSELDAAKKKAKSEIDKKTGEVRLSYITVIPGQEMTYQEKERQASEYLSITPRPDEIGYPALTEEIGVTGATAEAVAQAVMTQATAWRYIGPKIEGLRLKGKKAVSESLTLDEVQTNLTNYLQGLEGLKTQ